MEVLDWATEPGRKKKERCRTLEIEVESSVRAESVFSRRKKTVTCDERKQNLSNGI